VAGLFSAIDKFLDFTYTVSHPPSGLEFHPGLNRTCNLAVSLSITISAAL